MRRKSSGDLLYNTVLTVTNRVVEQKFVERVNLMLAIFLPPINKLKTYKISGEEHKRKIFVNVIKILYFYSLKAIIKVFKR